MELYVAEIITMPLGVVKQHIRFIITNIKTFNMTQFNL